jgi:signal peptidase I
MRVVLTDSMVPKINPGDLVVSANWVKPGLGEVAIYHERDVLGNFQQDVVHRVITINANKEYQFKGDNNQSMDALSVPQADVLGTVFLKLPGVGKLLTSAGLLFLLLIIGGITAIVYGIRALRK